MNARREGIGGFVKGNVSINRSVPVKMENRRNRWKIIRGRSKASREMRDRMKY